MNSKLLPGLALVLGGGWFGCSAAAETSANANQWRGFEIFPPITNTNPSIRVPLLVRVPTKLKIERASDILSVEIDKGSLDATKLTVGTKMVTGVESKVYVYPDGQPRPANGGYSTAKPHAQWPMFYDAEKGPERISILREPQPLGFYTNGIPDWNDDLRNPAAKITTVALMDLGRIQGHQILQAHLSLTDVYYTDAMMILEEISPQIYLPVYVQDYNAFVRSPAATSVSKQAGKIVIQTGMDYAGSGHFHNRYKIIVSPDRAPKVTHL